MYRRTIIIIIIIIHVYKLSSYVRYEVTIIFIASTYSPYQLRVWKRRRRTNFSIGLRTLKLTVRLRSLCEGPESRQRSIGIYLKEHYQATCWKEARKNWQDHRGIPNCKLIPRKRCQNHGRCCRWVVALLFLFFIFSWLRCCLGQYNSCDNNSRIFLLLNILMETNDKLIKQFSWSTRSKGGFKKRFTEGYLSVSSIIHPLYPVVWHFLW